MYMNNGLGMRIILTQINLISPTLQGYSCLRPVAGILSKFSLVPSPRSTHLGSGNVYFTSRESYSCDCACSRKDYSTKTSDFFQLLLFDKQVKEKIYKLPGQNKLNKT